MLRQRTKFEYRYLSKILNGRNKQKSGQPNLARQKNIQKKFCKFLLIITNFSGGTKAENSYPWLPILHGERGEGGTGAETGYEGGGMWELENVIVLLCTAARYVEIFIPERRNLNLAKEEAHEIMVIQFNILNICVLFKKQVFSFHIF
jgi:hypothetical protein